MGNKIKRFFKISLKLILCFFLVTVAWVAIYRFINPPITPLMVIRYLEGDSINKNWRDYEQISKNMAFAVIAAEDQNFFDHEGFDVEAIEEAIEKNKKRKRIRGASTISQQAAKNVFLWPSRTWIRKGFEAYFTFLIETLWSKKRILEIYLNLVEMGGGIYGAESAAKTYFGKSAENLTREEAALIAAVLPNPRRWTPQKPSGYVNKRQTWIMRQMSNLSSEKILSEME